MKKGINLALTKSLYDFNLLLERVIKSLSLGKRLTELEPYPFDFLFFVKRPWEYRIGKEVSVTNNDFRKKAYKKTKSREKLTKKEIDSLLSGAFLTQKEIDSVVSSSYKFWIGFGWEENGKRESCLWIEFVKENCGEKYVKKLDRLVGTSGKYYQEVVLRFVDAPVTAKICIFMKDEYLKQFYDENVSLSAQEEILTGFMNEVLDKL